MRLETVSLSLQVSTFASSSGSLARRAVKSDRPWAVHPLKGDY
jgi:hypothetical protein